MTEELKPCPFCGEESVGFSEHAIDAYTNYGWGSVSCSNCDSVGPYKSTKAEAIAAWNRRAQPPAEPAGWKLVPVEPTPEMLMAAVRSREGPAVYNVTSAKGLAVLESDAADDYRAMLAAAPQPATDAEPPDSEAIRQVMEAVDYHAKACIDRYAGEPLNTASTRRGVMEAVVDLVRSHPPRPEPLTEGDIKQIHDNKACLPDMIGMKEQWPEILRFARAIESAIRAKGEQK